MKDLEARIAARIIELAEEYVDQIPDRYAVTACEVEQGFKQGAKAVERIHYLRGAIDAANKIGNGLRSMGYPLPHKYYEELMRDKEELEAILGKEGN